MCMTMCMGPYGEWFEFVCLYVQVVPNMQGFISTKPFIIVEGLS